MELGEEVGQERKWTVSEAISFYFANLLVLSLGL